MSLRIYAKPQDTECGRLSFHGEVSKNYIVKFKCEIVLLFEKILIDLPPQSRKVAILWPSISSFPFRTILFTTNKSLKFV